MLRRHAVTALLCAPTVIVAAALTAGAAGSEPAPTSAALPSPPPPACPVTLPSGGAPPSASEFSESVYVGSGSLWTVLWPEGTVVFEPGGPGFVLPDGALGMKWGWIPDGPGELAVSGRRLDGDAPPLRAKISEGFTPRGRFFPSYLVFPTPGCWEVTGQLGDSRLTFVTRVKLVGDGPGWRPATVP